MMHIAPVRVCTCLESERGVAHAGRLVMILVRADMTNAAEQSRCSRRIDEVMDAPINPRALLRIVLYRKWAFLIPVGIALAAAISANVLLPQLYRSQATILIESQEIPANVVPSLVSEQIDRRLQVITQEVMTAQNLLRIADLHGLYADERDELPRPAIAARMSAHIETESIVMPFNDPRTGRTGQTTLAFRIAFADEDPRVARDITSALVSAFLSNDAESRRSVAEQTTGFLASEREQVDVRIAALEDEFAEFRTANRELLPDEAAFKRELLNDLGNRLRSIETDLRILRERDSYLATQLALIDEFQTPSGRGDTPESRLEFLRAELASAQARYNASHPDVTRLAREVRSLEQVVGQRSGVSAIAEREAALRSQLATLQDRYTNEHPDVQRVSRELEAVRREIELTGGRAAGAGANRNPTFVQLSAQLNSVRAEISAIEDQRSELREEQLGLQMELAKAPSVEQEYERLVRRLENAVADRDELANKETAARLSSALDATAAGGRLTLIEPPTFPNAPYSPSTKLLLAVGLVLGVGGGGVSLVLRELMDQSVRSTDDVAKLLGDSPIVSIPKIVTQADRRRSWLRRIAIATVVLVIVGLGLSAVHLRVAPLDVLIFQAMGVAEAWVPDLSSGADDALVRP